MGRQTTNPRHSGRPPLPFSARRPVCAACRRGVLRSGVRYCQIDQPLPRPEESTRKKGNEVTTTSPLWTGRVRQTLYNDQPSPCRVVAKPHPTVTLAISRTCFSSGTPAVHSTSPGRQPARAAPHAAVRVCQNLCHPRGHRSGSQALPRCRLARCRC